MPLSTARLQISAALTLCICLALISVGCDRLERRLIERQAARNLGADRVQLLQDDKLHVVLCGTGSPIADPTRANACTAVLAGGHFFIVDIGPGATEQVTLERLPRAQLEGLLLTHFHSDHIGELGELNMQTWVAGRSKPLVVYGPPGVDQVVDGFTRAYAFDAQYRVAHHGAETLPPSVAPPQAKTVVLPAADGEAVVFEADGLRVTAFAAAHEPVVPAYGYRFDYRGRSVVISGDTKKSNNVIKHAHGADVLVHEALARRMIEPVTEYARRQNLTRWAKLTSDIIDYHTTPVDAALVAKEAGAHMLVLTHLVPPLPNFIARRMFLRGVSTAWDGRVELGYDGMHLTLPPNSTEISLEALK